MSHRHDLAAEAYWHASHPPPVHEHVVLAMAARPTGWSRREMAQMLLRVRVNRAREVGRLGFALSDEWWSTGPQGDQPKHRAARRMLRNAERLLRRALAEVPA